MITIEEAQMHLSTVQDLAHEWAMLLTRATHLSPLATVFATAVADALEKHGPKGRGITRREWHRIADAAQDLGEAAVEWLLSEGARDGVHEAAKLGLATVREARAILRDRRD